MKRALLSLAVLGLVGGLAGACADPRVREREARVHVFEALSVPDRPVVVGPAVVQDAFAIVDWTRGSFSGGRTLLRHEKGGWVMVACGGEALRSRPTLQRAGVPDGTAGVLSAKLRREENRVGDRLDRINNWQGLGAKAACPEPKPEPAAG